MNSEGRFVVTVTWWTTFETGPGMAGRATKSFDASASLEDVRNWVASQTTGYGVEVTQVLLSPDGTPSWYRSPWPPTP